MELEAASAFGNYVIVGRLGAGGMGVVYLATHRQLGSSHAIKVLSDRRPEVDARLRQEGRLQASLSHPNVVRVTDTIDVGDRVGLVMEYVDGPTLAALLATRKLTVPEIDAIARGILRGVADAHARGWIHRDLKPGNVLLQSVDGAIVPKVADFGLAKVVGGESGPTDASIGATTANGLGTRGYMSFEQLAGFQPDARMDVFALGALLFELAVGRPAFPSTAIWEAAIRSGSVPEPDRAELPERMRRAIRAALGDVAVRPADARELLALWDDGPAVLPSGPFRQSTLDAARGSPARPVVAHLPPSRLRGQPLTASEQAHVDACLQCRCDLRLARARSAARGDDPYSDGVDTDDDAEVDLDIDAAGLALDDLLDPHPSPATWVDPADDLGPAPANTSGASPAPVRSGWRAARGAGIGAALLAAAALAVIGWSSTRPTADPASTAPAPAPAPELPRPSSPRRRPSSPAPEPPAPEPAPPALAPSPAPAPARPRPPAPVPDAAPVGVATVIVNTLGGPAGRFRLDDGPVLAVGPPRRQKTTAGRHALAVWGAHGDDPVWTGEIELRPDEERVVCWDLARDRFCTAR